MKKKKKEKNVKNNLVGAAPAKTVSLGLTRYSKKSLSSA